jgi:hypothetical protein
MACEAASLSTSIVGLADEESDAYKQLSFRFMSFHQIKTVSRMLQLHTLNICTMDLGKGPTFVALSWLLDKPQRSVNLATGTSTPHLHKFSRAGVHQVMFMTPREPASGLVLLTAIGNNDHQENLPTHYTLHYEGRKKLYQSQRWVFSTSLRATPVNPYSTYSVYTIMYMHELSFHVTIQLFVTLTSS